MRTVDLKNGMSSTKTGVYKSSSFVNVNFGHTHIFLMLIVLKGGDFWSNSIFEVCSPLN